jgi:hypothetical protein
MCLLSVTVDRCIEEQTWARGNGLKPDRVIVNNCSFTLLQQTDVFVVLCIDLVLTDLLLQSVIGAQNSE